MSHTVLIVEDEPKLAELLSDYLQQAGMSVHKVLSGEKALDSVFEIRPDLLLLDLMLPHKDGLSICRELRQSEIFQRLPIIITTARVDEIDRLLGLELGADDYICKPYSPREVVARVKAVLRRLDQPAQLIKASSILSLDDNKMKVSIKGAALNLTAVEYALFKLLVDKPGYIYSRSRLMDSIYRDYRVVSERTIDSHIKKIRQKITAVAPDLELIRNKSWTRTELLPQRYRSTP
ncbi:MAG: response regulator [Pseudomonadota bacterium]